MVQTAVAGRPLNADRRARVEAGAMPGHRRLGGGDGDEQGAFVGHDSERTGSSAAAATRFSHPEGCAGGGAAAVAKQIRLPDFALCNPP